MKIFACSGTEAAVDNHLADAGAYELSGHQDADRLPDRQKPIPVSQHGGTGARANAPSVGTGCFSGGTPTLAVVQSAVVPSNEGHLQAHPLVWRIIRLKKT
jgi:hypothetical protein